MHPWYVANNLIKYYICVIVFCCIYFYSILVKETEKAMAPHSSTLAWKILWTEEPGRLQSVGSRRVGHDWATSLSLFTFHFHALEKEMATHSIVLAWRIPGKGEPGGLPSMGSHSQTRLKRLSSSSSCSSQGENGKHWYGLLNPKDTLFIWFDCTGNPAIWYIYWLIGYNNKVISNWLTVCEVWISDLA